MAFAALDGYLQTRRRQANTVKASLNETRQAGDDKGVVLLSSRIGSGSRTLKESSSANPSIPDVASKGVVESKAEGS